MVWRELEESEEGEQYFYANRLHHSQPGMMVSRCHWEPDGWFSLTFLVGMFDAELTDAIGALVIDSSLLKVLPEWWEQVEQKRSGSHHSCHLVS